jgi:hypothetical protein
MPSDCDGAADDITASSRPSSNLKYFKSIYPFHISWWTPGDAAAARAQRCTRSGSGRLRGGSANVDLFDFFIHDFFIHEEKKWSHE